MKKLLTLAFVLTFLLSAAVVAGAVPDTSQKISVETSEEFEALVDSAQLSAESQEAFLAASFSGNGTESSPYLISTSSELFAFAQNINNGIDVDKYYRLEADIDLSGQEWTPIGSYTSKTLYSACFQGVFDGNGHTVSNFKITKNTYKYIGFFGFVYNGTVKNLTISNASINVVVADYIYTGVLVGRSIAMEGGHVEISSCTVKNSFVNAASVSRSSYAGAVCGYFMASDLASASVFETKAVDCAVTAETRCELTLSVYAYAGGFMGYFAANNSSSVTASDCYASVETSAVHTKSGKRVFSFSGGAFSFIGAGTGESRVSIERCFALGSSDAQSYARAFSGGFTGYISTESDYSANALVINDCYSTGAATALCLTNEAGYNYTCVGGFAGQIYDAEGISSLNNCYSLGNAVDLGSDEAYAGVFCGYNELTELNNCYVTDNVFAKGTELFTKGMMVVDYKSGKNAQVYNGFDFENTWKFDEQSDYPFPVLSYAGHIPYLVEINFISADELFISDIIAPGDSFELPVTNPSRQDDAQYTYEFVCWSDKADGEGITPQPVYAPLNVYAVYQKQIRSYTVKFLSENALFGQEHTYPYGSVVEFPKENPQKQPDYNYWYSFSHWSISPDGERVNSEYIVNGDITFYAVFKSLDFRVWNGEETQAFSRGDGSKENPFEISTGAQLAFLAQKVNEADQDYTSASYELVSDIRLGGFEWTPIGTSQSPFSGIFDGAGYTVDALCITSADNISAALFGNISDAVIKNISLTNVDIDINAGQRRIFASPLVASVIGLNGKSEISQIKTQGKVNVVGENTVYAGGIAASVSASADASVEICDSYSNVVINATSDDADAYCGGVIANVYSDGTKVNISRCYSRAGVTSSAAAQSLSSGVAAKLGAYSDGEILVFGSFSVGDISAVTLSDAAENSVAGHILALSEGNVSAEDCIYLRTAKVYSFMADNVEAAVNSTGIGASSANFKNKSFLTANQGFDFEDVWEILTDYSYPTLKHETKQKPEFNVGYISKTSKVILADVTVMTDSSSAYTVSLNVYSDRGRLIGTKSTTVTNTTPSLRSLTLKVSDISGVEEAKSVVVMVTDKVTLAPLFTAVTKNI